MISVTITADDIGDLAAQMAGFFPSAATIVQEPVEAEVIDPPKKPGRKPKPPIVIDSVVNPPESPAEEPKVEEPSEPTKTLAEMRELIVAWVSDTATAKGGGDDAKQGALGALRKEFGFQKVAEIPPEKFGAIVEYMDANPPA
jgi:hypothetical protein